MPKIELHLHLEGSIRPETVRELSIERLGWTGPLPSGWEETYYTYTDFIGFMQQLTPRFPGTPQEYHRIAFECIEDLAHQSVVYAEISFDVPVRSPDDTGRFWPIVEALEDARREASARYPINVRYIAALMRTLPEVALLRVQLAAQARDRGVGIAGIDLHGDEVASLGGQLSSAFALAKQLGLRCRAHAGEARGPESIREVIDLLGVDRIGHGVRALEDPELLARLRKGDITLELCPTSNVRTAIVPSLRAHPIRRFFDLGIPVTVNSDDPLPFFTTIEREYRLLVEEFGFTRDELRAITLTAANASFLPDSERADLAALIEERYDTTDGAATESA